MSQRQFYVYEHTRNDSGAVFYVGKGSGRRAWSVKKRVNKHWHNIVAKHGHQVRIVADCLNEDLAFFAECERIDQLTRLGFQLVNRTRGGDGVSLVGEAKENHRRAINTPEIKAKKSANGRRIMSDPVFRARMREAYNQPENRVRRLDAMRAAIRTPEELARRRKQLDATRSKEQIRRANEAAAAARSKPVVCVETGQNFGSASAAANWFNCASGANISAVCNGKRKAALGYTWRYL